MARRDVLRNGYRFCNAAKIQYELWSNVKSSEVMKFVAVYKSFF